NRYGPRQQVRLRLRRAADEWPAYFRPQWRRPGHRLGFEHLSAIGLRGGGGDQLRFAAYDASRSQKPRTAYAKPPPHGALNAPGGCSRSFVIQFTNSEDRGSSSVNEPLSYVTQEETL